MNVKPLFWQTHCSAQLNQVMEERYVYLIIGVIIGWITKLPFLIKWYKELKETKDYKNRRSQAFLDEIKRLESIYNKKAV